MGIFLWAFLGLLFFIGMGVFLIYGFFVLIQYVWRLFH